MSSGGAERVAAPVTAPVTADLTLRFKRHTDGTSSLTVVRRDGSTTWQRFVPSTATVMPQHDLTHYAVETTLGFAHGFYGLLADGWAIGDFAAPWPRGEIPDEAREVELIVGFFDSDRRHGARDGGRDGTWDGGRDDGGCWTAVEFAEHAERFVEAARARGKRVPPRTRLLTDADIVAVREAVSALVARWSRLPPGEVMTLTFERPVGDGRAQ